MSSILKALKKLEEEKTARKPDSLKIDAEILRDGSGSRSPVKFVAIAAALFACGGGATYLVMKPAPASKVGAVAAIPAAPARPVPQPPAAVPVERITVEPVATAPPTAPVAQVRQAPPSNRAQAPAKPAPTPPPANQQKQHPVREQKVPTAVPSQVAKAAQPRAAAPAAQAPALKVSGIAFQEGIDSVAMINGVPLSKGMTIEGARVETIHRDRVQFSFGSEKFEIPLGKSNR